MTRRSRSPVGLALTLLAALAFALAGCNGGGSNNGATAAPGDQGTGTTPMETGTGY